jgi:hypothetical protein
MIDQATATGGLTRVDKKWAAATLNPKPGAAA